MKRSNTATRGLKRPTRWRTPTWLFGSAILFGSTAAPLPGQEAAPPRPPADSLEQVLSRLAGRLDALEAGTCPDSLGLPPREPETTGVAVRDSLARTVWRLEIRMHRLARETCRGGPESPPSDSGLSELAALRAAAAEAAGAADTAAQGPVRFIGRQRSGNALNPEISVTGNVHYTVDDAGNPQTDNAFAREFEFSFQSALDPFSHTKIFLSASEEGVGVEEGYVYLTGLPGRIRLDAGMIRQQVGELNRWHLHSLPESDFPLVYQRYLGEEGLAAVGLSLYTALPFSAAGGTHEVWLQGTTAESEPLFAESRQPTLLARVQNFWQVSRSAFFQVGVTGVGGNNAEEELESRLLGLDVRVTVRPPHAGTRREFTLRAEGYRLHATDRGEVTNRYGMFGQAQFRLDRRIVLGARYDRVEAARGRYATEWQIVPSLTWWQSEWVYLRLEGRHGRLEGETQSRLVAQIVWALGPHKHENY